MCKIKLFLFASLFLGIVNCTYGEENKTVNIIYPQYEEVVDYLFDNYSVDDYDYLQLTFRKDIEGYFACFSEYYPSDEVVEKFCIWDAKDQQFKELNLSKIKNKEENLKLKKLHLRGGEIHKYNCCPYYGYSGWTNDVIEDFKDFDSMSDTLLYGVARAYFDKSVECLYSNSYYSDYDNKGFVKDGSNFKMDDVQFAEYLGYVNKNNELLQELLDRNPDFQTFIGPIEFKLHNDIVASFYDTYIFRNYEDAIKQLKVDLYNESIIAIAKNYLNSCPQNSILLTFGDNDTYPILYVQHKLNYRKDVLVICSPFLSSEWYIDFLRNDSLISDKFPISVPESSYQDNARDVLYFVEDDSIAIKEAISINNMLEYSLSNVNSSIYYEEDDIYTYNVTEIYLDVNQENVKSSHILNSSEVDIEDRIEIKLSNSYLYKGDFILLDILRTNDWERPIAFTSKHPIYGISFKNCIENTGFSYVLKPIVFKDEIGFDKDYLYNYLMNIMVGFNPNKLGEEYKDIFVRTLGILSFRETFKTVAVMLADSGEIEKAEEIIDKCDKISPHDIFPPSIFEVDYAEAYYKTDRLEQGDKFLMNLIDKYEIDLDNYYSMNISKQKENLTNINIAMEGYRRVLGVLHDNDRVELYNELEPEFNLYMLDYNKIIDY